MMNHQPAARAALRYATKTRSLLATLLVPLALALPLTLSAQQIRVDLNEAGRQPKEVNALGYTPWAIHGGQSDTKTFGHVTVTFTRVGPHGTGLTTTWYKAGVENPHYVRLAGDGITVEDGNQGAGIEMRISGLTPGPHTVLTFHNNVQSPEGHTFSPLNIYVDGKRQVHDLKPGDRILKNGDAVSAYLHLNAVKGKDVVILFAADTTVPANVKDIIINGFELNTPNRAAQARMPVPANGDGHVQVTGGSYTLHWSPAPGAASADVYFGTDSAAVAAARKHSPLFKGRVRDTSWKAKGLYSMLTYYWRVDELHDGEVTKGDVWTFRPAQLAFPGAQGYGRFARGGRGGRVVEVTNLHDSGPGSLRAAVTGHIGPRTIVFAVSGLITLQSRLNLKDPFITIAGQTAPGKGICIRRATLGVTGNDDVIRFVRIRLGKENVSYGGMGLTGCDHSIIDHCSISWTMDEAFSSRGAKNITLQHMLISEALNVAGHHNYPPGTAHGYAASIGGDVGSFNYNLLADCYGRNWSLAGGVNGDGYYTGLLDIRDNVVYNWGTRATDGGAHEVNFVNNYYKPGPGTTFFYAFNAQHEGYGGGMQRCYFKGNVMPGHFNERTERRGRESTKIHVKYATFVDSAFFPPHVRTVSAENAYVNVLSDVGCNEPCLDDHDIRIISETLKGTTSVTGSVSGKKGFPDNEADAGGYENYPEVHRPASWDSDHDGLPDWWEDIHGLNPHSPKGDFSDANADTDKDGFTNLDDYLAWMADPHYLSPDGRAITIDLHELARGYGGTPSFHIDGAKNGTVKLSSGQAVFTPAGKGAGSFTFTVKDGQGDTMTRQVNILSGYAVKMR